MPPLMVVQTLAESQYATLSDIKVREEGLLVGQTLFIYMTAVSAYPHQVPYKCVPVLDTREERGRGGGREGGREVGRERGREGGRE